MISPTRFQIGAALLVASLATVSRGTDVLSTNLDPQACVAEYRVVFQGVGHPGKSIAFVQPGIEGAEQCSTTDPHPLYLVVYTDAPGGPVLLEGEHAAAIAEIRQARPTSPVDSLPLTNLCVAQIVARDWAVAQATCDSAIQAAHRDNARRPSGAQTIRDRFKDFIAVAYSNRAVLRVLSQNAAAGEEDLLSAQKASPRAAFVKRNLAATRQVREARMLAAATPKS
jgi:hypothetical protein